MVAVVSERSKEEGFGEDDQEVQDEEDEEEEEHEEESSRAQRHSHLQLADEAAVLPYRRLQVCDRCARRVARRVRALAIVSGHHNHSYIYFLHPSRIADIYFLHPSHIATTRRALLLQNQEEEQE